MTPYKIFNKVNSSETLQRPCVKIIKLFLPRIMDLTIFKSNLVISSSTNLLLWNTFIWFHSKSQGYYSQNVLQNLYLKYFFRNLRYTYNQNTAQIDNLHYHEFNEETPWKLYIPLVRSGGYLLTPNPGESPKEDMNSQLDLLHMNDEQVWSLTKVRIFNFLNFEYQSQKLEYFKDRYKL